MRKFNSCNPQGPSVALTIVTSSAWFACASAIPITICPAVTLLPVCKN